MTRQSPFDDESGNDKYARRMPVAANDVASALRERIPRLPVKKLHKLLYYCQGHHAAVYGQPLFEESVSAWDMGPIVGKLWKSEKEHGPRPGSPLSESELNTVGYVVSRYGRLSGRELEILTHHEDPWQAADRGRAAGGSALMSLASIRDWFQSEVDQEEIPLLTLGPDWLSGVAERARSGPRADDPQALRARLVR
jgi:uncharacterized phage-associated protein